MRFIYVRARRMLRTDVQVKLANEWKEFALDLPHCHKHGHCSTRAHASPHSYDHLRAVKTTVPTTSGQFVVQFSKFRSSARAPPRHLRL